MVQHNHSDHRWQALFDFFFFLISISCSEVTTKQMSVRNIRPPSAVRRLQLNSSRTGGAGMISKQKGEVGRGGGIHFFIQYRTNSNNFA
uniref:Putative secreted protein n=1 Tax=Anopheles triannulatus TaxID=58253 RepID=A0A2M4B2S2_9DIPT